MSSTLSSKVFFFCCFACTWKTSFLEALVGRTHCCNWTFLVFLFFPLILFRRFALLSSLTIKCGIAKLGGRWHNPAMCYRELAIVTWRHFCGVHYVQSCCFNLQQKWSLPQILQSANKDWPSPDNIIDVGDYYLQPYCFNLPQTLLWEPAQQEKG